jgi:hypothetical protein
MFDVRSAHRQSAGSVAEPCRKWLSTGPPWPLAVCPDWLYPAFLGACGHEVASELRKGSSRTVIWWVVDDAQAPNIKGHHKFPCGDSQRVGQAVYSQLARAGERTHCDVEIAVGHLRKPEVRHGVKPTADDSGAVGSTTV